LRQIAFQLERAGAPTYRVRAFRRAAQVISGLDAGEVERRIREDSLEALPGIGKTTAEVVTQAAAGQEPEYLARVLAEAPATEHSALRAALRGDCHTHSDWSERCGRRCAVTAIPTRTGPTAAARRMRWPRRPATWDTSGSR
jgi:putative hydrolase